MASSGQHRMQIPTFDPDRHDISAKAWLNLVDLGQQAAGKKQDGTDVWTDEITASHSILLLRGKAASWISNLIEEKDDSLKKWSDLKKKFRGRFCEKHSLSQKTKLISDLNQSPQESCQDFYDRVRCQLHVLYDEEWEDVSGGGAAADALARSKSIKMHHKVLFASGLRSDIKQDVIMQDMKSLDDLKAVAMRVEASVKETNKAQRPKVVDVNVVEAPAAPQEAAFGDEEDVEVDAVQRFQGQRRGFGNGGRGGGRGGQNRGAAGRFLGKCNYCQKVGHKFLQCYSRMNDEKQGIFKGRQQQQQQQQFKASAVDAQIAANSMDMSELLNQYAA